MTEKVEVIIIGAGFAGVEAAWFLASRGVRVLLYEMRPVKMTPAHKTLYFAEPVCSNSFKSLRIETAAGLLKEEMKMLGSIVLQVAKKHQVPAGQALAVERAAFAKNLTEIITTHPFVTVIREEVKHIPEDRPVILAVGPLASENITKSLQKYIGEFLYFYDAIAPVVSGESINMAHAFKGDRYDMGEGSYINCPLTEEEYRRFYDALINAEKVKPRPFEEEKFFEGCLPVEEMARRGYRSLLFGPMKPVGLTDPNTGQQPFAVVQLRPEDRQGRMYSMVGFQTRLKYGEQDRVFRMIPALKHAEFLRYGSIHRNTYVCSPKVLDEFLRLRKMPRVSLAGQITGVEGYMESALSGILCAYFIWKHLRAETPHPPPVESMTGALHHYVTSADPSSFSPMNANFGLLPVPENLKLRGDNRRRFLAARALESLKAWIRSELQSNSMV